MSLMDNKKFTEEVAVAAVILFFLVIGFLVGWGARCVSTNDRYLRAQAERAFSSAAYFDAKELEITEAVKKDEKARKAAKK